MKKIKALALALALIILAPVFVACAPANTTGEETTGNGTDPDFIPVFQNGEIFASVVANKTEVAYYIDVRAAIESAVGKIPTIYNDVLKVDTAAPAIVLGESGLDESKKVYDELGDAVAMAKIVGNKYVLAYKTPRAAAKLVETVVQLVSQKVSNGELVIDSSWNITLSASDVPSFDETKLSGALDLPLYNGKEFEQSIEIGDGSVLKTVNKVSREKFEKYVKTYKTSGFTYYTENVIGENKYYTYVTKDQIVNLMYFAANAEMRITVDSREKFDLPALAEDNVYEATSKPSFTMVSNGQTGYPGGMGFIFKLSDGSFFIIDGGISNEGSSNKGIWKWMYQTLRELADDPDNMVISGWLITHIHNDHLGAFMDMSEQVTCRNHITVKQVIYSQPTDEWMITAGIKHRINWMSNSIARWQPESVVKAHPGQQFTYADITITVLGGQDIVLPESIKSHNNSSVVTKVNFQGKSMLFLADSEGNQNRALYSIYGKELDTDVIQVAHHGYNNTSPENIYGINNATLILWPVSTHDYDTAGKANVSALNINKKFFQSNKTNLVARESNITIKNFDTWVAEPRWEPKV